MAPSVDFSKPRDLIGELFDPDDGTKKQFNDRFSRQVIEFAERLSPGFARFEKLMEGQHGMQTALVCMFCHGVLDDLVISVKLLLTGKLSASGNLARQATEGICMAIMCAHADTLSIGKKEQIYWKLVEADDPAAEGHLASRQFVENWIRIDLNQAGAQQLKETIETHHGHSHAGRLAAANRMDLGPNGKLHIGGHFDIAKLETYELEFKQRMNICGSAIEALDALQPRINAILQAAPPFGNISRSPDLRPW